MKLHIIRRYKPKKDRIRIPASFLATWTAALTIELKRQGVKDSRLGLDLQLVFVSALEMKRLNRQFRGKNKVTDVLSFAAIEPDLIGELVLCPDVLKRQALEHGLTFQAELGYMVLHGVLHLLGFDHERSQQEAHRMFELQDKTFEKLLSRGSKRSGA